MYRENREKPKSLQRLLMITGKEVTVFLTNQGTITGILDSFCLRPALAYLVIETKETLEVINFNNVITMRVYKEPE